MRSWEPAWPENPKHLILVENIIKIQVFFFLINVTSKGCFSYRSMLGEQAPFPIPRKEWVSVYITVFSWMATLPEGSSSCQSHLFPSRNITTGTSTFNQNCREASLWFLAEMSRAKLVPLMETGIKFPPWLHQVWGLSPPLLLPIPACHHWPPLKLPRPLWYPDLCKKAPKINTRSLTAFWGNHKKWF